MHECVYKGCVNGGSSGFQDNLAGCRKLQEMFTSIEEEKRLLAGYLCEDPSRLDLQDVFNTLKAFRALFIKAYNLDEANLKLYSQ